MTTSANDVIAAIVRGELDNDIETVLDAVIARKKAASKLRAAQAKATLSVGDRVRLTGISPKALDGATATVCDVFSRGSRIGVEIDKEFAGVAGRFSGMIRMGIPVQVPASCVVPA